MPADFEAPPAPQLELDPSDEELLRSAKKPAPSDDEGEGDADEPEDDSELEAAGEEGEKPKKSWLKSASELKQQAEEAKREAAAAKAAFDALQERMARIEASNRERESPAPKKEAKRNPLGGSELLDIITEKGEAGLEEVISEAIESRLAAALERQEKAIEARFNKQNELGALVAEHRFLADPSSPSYKAALSRAQKAIGADPALAGNTEVFRMAAELARAQAEIAELKTRRKGPSSGMVGDGASEGDDFDSALPSGIEDFMKAANAFHGKTMLSRSDLRAALRGNRKVN